jgi:transcriptional regulator with XRE-family HTH domain
MLGRINQLCEGMTVAEVARITRTNPETARRFLNGMNHPTVRFLAGLCAHTRASLDWVVLGRQLGSQGIDAAAVRRRAEVLSADATRLLDMIRGGKGGVRRRSRRW